MKPLYQIASILKRCFRIDENTAVDGETGEVFDAAYLDQLKMEKSKKADNIACWIKELQAEAEACKAQENAFKERRQRAEKKIKSLSDYLTAWIPGETIETKRASIRWRKSVAVVVTDESRIPEEFRIRKVTESIDKAEIRRALKNGSIIEGASLEERQNIQIG